MIFGRLREEQVELRSSKVTAHPQSRSILVYTLVLAQIVCCCSGFEQISVREPDDGSSIVDLSRFIARDVVIEHNDGSISTGQLTEVRDGQLLELTRGNQIQRIHMSEVSEIYVEEGTSCLLTGILIAGVIGIGLFAALAAYAIKVSTSD